MSPVTSRAREALSTGRRVARQVGRVVRAILGVPDYERYVSHMRRHHPGVAVMTHAEFARHRLEERYSRPGARCC